MPFMADKLATYRRRRNFSATPEPAGNDAADSGIGAFTVQRHDARRLHYDFRLELDGVLRSWAVPKGPSLDPAERRLAVEVEDHPLEYGEFEGRIPEGHYGAGQVELWDRGTWSSIDADPVAALKKGRLKFRLHGFKLHGAWTLVRMAKREEEKDAKQNWLLIKEDDGDARSGEDAEITERAKGSVKSRVERMSRHDPLPDFIEPQLATLVSHPPLGNGWIYEIKYDGYRLLARLDRGSARLYTRNRNDWTSRLPTLARQLAQLGLDGSWLDGEIVVLAPDGTPDFQALQNAFDRGAETGVQFCIFDAPWLQGEDLTPLPLVERKLRLAEALAKAGSGDGNLLTFSQHFPVEVGGAQAALEQACGLGLEGLIGKRADAPYTGRRSGDWIKLKCRQRQEFVIGGYSDPAGSRQEFGALLLGLHDDQGKLRYAGRVGTGFDETQLKALGKRLRAMVDDRSPFVEPPQEKDTHWVRPELVAEVAYAGWTREKQLRQASFLGLRSDKFASSVRREVAREPEEATATSSTELPTGQVAREVAGVKLTHPERLIWPESGTDGGITKTDLARYVERVGPWLLPHLAQRPLSLLRCPDGSNAECFFQKHLGRTRPVGVQTFLWEASSTGKRDYVYVDSVEAVVGLVQRGIVEFHTWGASLPHPDRPDRLTIDLDPAPDVPWSRVVEGAQLARTLLEELGLVPFLKTTGGKGLHLVVPLVPQLSWPEAKAFAKAIATHLAQVLPDRFTANMAKSKRVGRIFVDYLRNDEGATAVAAYSPRARPGAPVSLPLAWEELSPGLNPADWTLRTVPARLASLAMDPWQGYGESAKFVTDGMRKALGIAKA